MADVEELDRRLTDVEALIGDFPDLINLRFERVLATQSEITARLNILDRQLATLTRDVRDMRAAVTRQLIGQDERFAQIEQRLDAQEKRSEAQDKRLASLERRFDATDAKLDQILAVLKARP